jgi:hypothetical protein
MKDVLNNKRFNIEMFFLFVYLIWLLYTYIRVLSTGHLVKEINLCN